MKEVIVLKNLNRTLTAIYEEKGTAGKIESILASFVDKGPNGTTEYEGDENNNAKVKGSSELFEPKTLLPELLNNRKRDFYKDLLQNKYNEIENLIILSGAGSSVGIGSDGIGLTMQGLWDKIEELEKDCLQRIIKECNYAALTDKGEIDPAKLVKDLESLLSKAGMKSLVDGNDSLKNDIKTARMLIAKLCSLKLPAIAPHSSFLNKVVLRPQKFPRVKIFTLNYDTLFEQAASKEKFTVIDGFTFSTPRVFNGKYFDYDLIETRHNRQDKKDSTIAKLFYLFKMHGSLNWKLNGQEIEQDEKEIDVEQRVMIFPQDSKYEHSYEQPYFEMMARFQQSLRVENTLLICIGFSFIDKHISSVILETLKQNPSLHLIVLTFPQVVDQWKPYQIELHRITELQSRVTLIGESFNEFTLQFPENIAHKRVDVLEELNSQLKKIASGNATAK